jgi:flavodoxin-like protein
MLVSATGTARKMRALIVYESMFGNTEEIARAVAKGMSELSPDLVEIASAPAQPPDWIELLVVGGPTHGHGMSRRGTRRTAADQAGPALVSQGAGLREWLSGLVPAGRDFAVATFDTRFDKARWVTGSAAAGAARLLRRRGYRLVAAPASFFVVSTAGPLVPGEVERAQGWGAILADQVLGHPVGR